MDLEPKDDDSADAVLRNNFVEVMEMMDKRLNDKGKNWRHVFKVGRQRAQRESARLQAVS